MAENVDPKHLTGILGTVGKNLAAMPEGKRVVAELREAHSSEDVVFLLQSAQLGIEDPAKEMVLHAVQDEAQWEEIRATLLRSAELQLTERYSSNA